MRIPLLLVAMIAAGSTRLTDVGLIDELNECLTARFQDPAPNALGMSRAVGPASMGTHYRPFQTMERDFRPENARETQVLAALEQQHMQVGFYLFGRSISEVAPDKLSYRALKGPGAITAGTPRAAWYPGTIRQKVEGEGLPDWMAMYPVARMAMKTFAAGGKGYATTVDGWQVVARPVLADSTRCVTCHGQGATLHEALGGAMYAYRRAAL